MKKVFSILAVSFASANAQTVFADQANIESVETNFQYYKDAWDRPQYFNGDYGMSHNRYVAEGVWEGRAEFYNGTHWGTICDDPNFNISAADVICRSLHPKYGAVNWTNVGSLSWIRQNEFSDGYKKPIFMDDVSCSGNERVISQCSYKSVSNCQHGEDVVVTCSGFSNHTTKGAYRLANPKNMTQSDGTFLGVWGRAEYFNYSLQEPKWTQICNDNFTLNNARVICRSLGLPLRDVRFSNAHQVTSYHGYDLIVKGPWYYSNVVNCNGTESYLNECPQKSRVYCSHNQDVYVHCSN